MLKKSIQNLYRVFEKYPLAKKIIGCPHCELDNAESKLHNNSLKNLTWEDFGVYPAKAMTTFGEVDDFKHFLPRLLELYAIDYNNLKYDFDYILHKLEYGHWEDWDKLEQQAVSNFVRSWFDSLDSNYDESGYICSIYEEIHVSIQKFKLYQ